MSAENSVFDWLPCSVVFVAAAHGEKRDIMTATAMFVSEKEPLIAISIAKNHLTDQLIDQSGEFILGVASEVQKELVWQLGGAEGEEKDKFKYFSAGSITPKMGKPPIPEGISAWMACQVISKQEVDGYHLVVARVVDQKDLGKPPLVWQKNALFALRPL